jgi:hypothetical protein
MMGYVGYFYVDSKSFEFRFDVRGGVQLVERSKGVSRSVIKAWPTVLAGECLGFLVLWRNDA